MLRVDHREARDFYEIEAVRNGWSARQLERQINSLLFFRLLKSRDKKGLLALANNRDEMMIQTELDLSQAGRKYARESMQQPAFLRDAWKQLLALCKRRLRMRR